MIKHGAGRQIENFLNIKSNIVSATMLKKDLNI